MKQARIYLLAVMASTALPIANAGSIAHNVIPTKVNVATSLSNVVTDPDEDSIGGSVSRAIFTNAVVNREPIDQFSQLRSNGRHVYFFTELKGLTGETVVHRWELDGQIVNEVPFEVGGPRWRVWSSHTLATEAYGEWRVSIIDVNGRVIDSRTLQFIR